MECKRCGAKIKRGKESCPVCGMPALKRRKWPWAVGIVSLLAVSVLSFFISSYFCMRGTVDSWTSDEYKYEFREVVKSTVDASQSDSVLSVEALASDLNSRGFKDIIISAGYTMRGELLEEELLDPAAKEKYPLYIVFYTTPQGNAWIMYSVDGELEASPLFADDEFEGRVMIVENDHLTSYDSRTNTFMRTVPSESEIELKRMTRIDAQVLSSLDTAQKIEELR